MNTALHAAALDFLEAKRRARSVDQHDWIGFGRVAELGETGDLLVVIGADRMTGQHLRPEPRQRRGALAVEPRSP